jgi:hypothetical protein
MARTPNSHWEQPTEYYAVVKDGKGTFVRIPDLPELATVAENHGAESADKLFAMVVRAHSAGFSADGTRATVFDRMLKANSEVRNWVKERLQAAGKSVDDSNIDANIMAPANRRKLIAMFGDQVAALGYTPSKRGAGETTGESGIAEL